jgi:hypothetical protein
LGQADDFGDDRRGGQGHDRIVGLCPTFFDQSADIAYHLVKTIDQTLRRLGIVQPHHGASFEHQAAVFPHAQFDQFGTGRADVQAQHGQKPLILEERKRKQGKSICESINNNSL